jgi:tetratricopeptide (TPR) repeat protein
LDGAIKVFTEAIHLRPDFASTYNARGFIWEKKEDYYAAIADYQKRDRRFGKVK